MCGQLHVRSYGHPLSWVKREASGLLTTQQTSAQAVQSLLRKRVRKSAYAAVPNHLLLSNAKLNGSLTTNQIIANPSSRLQYTKKGCARAHVQLYPTLNFRKSLANGSLITYRISAQSVQPFRRYRKGGTSARTRLRMWRRTTPITCVICIAAWSLNTDQI